MPSPNIFTRKVTDIAFSFDFLFTSRVPCVPVFDVPASPRPILDVLKSLVSRPQVPESPHTRPDVPVPLLYTVILLDGSSLHPQHLILLKIAAATRTYGLHLGSEAFFSFFRLFLLYFPCGGKKTQTRSTKCTFKVTFFIFLKLLNV